MVAAAVIGGHFTHFSVHDARFPTSLDDEYKFPDGPAWSR